MTEYMPQDKPATFIKKIFQGILIGFGCILPGVSGGVIAVSFGLYRPILDGLAGLRRAFFRNFLWLLPLGLGGVAGLLAGAFLLNELLALYTVPLLALFIGLILGGVPAFIREANGEGFRPRYLLATLLLALLVCSLLLLDKDGAASRPLVMAASCQLNYLQCLLAGAVIAIGTIVPGISTSFILIYLGWYAQVLAALSKLQILPCLLILAGALICGLLLLKLIRWLFDRYHGWAYYAVFGFLLGSVALVCPQLAGGQPLLLAVMIAIGLASGYLLTAKKKN